MTAISPPAIARQDRWSNQPERAKASPTNLISTELVCVGSSAPAAWTSLGAAGAKNESSHAERDI